MQKNVSSKPLDHIPPLFGKINISYQRHRFRTDFFVLWNETKRLDEYNPEGEDNAQYASPVGSLGWYTLNLNSSAEVYKGLRIQFAIENILDIAYRNFASGISAPGRNFMVTIRYSH